jgi:predicted phosphodiesterase
MGKLTGQDYYVDIMAYLVEKYAWKDNVGGPSIEECWENYLADEETNPLPEGLSTEYAKHLFVTLAEIYDGKYEDALQYLNDKRNHLTKDAFIQQAKKQFGVKTSKAKALYILDTYALKHQGPEEATIEGTLVGEKEESPETLDEMHRLAKRNQALTDMQRIERATWRKDTRKENAVTEYNEKLLKVFEEHSLSIAQHTQKHDNREDSVVIVQITDPHFNELISMENNKYDFHVASARLYQFAQRIKQYASCHHASRCVLAMTGDLLNSDRRLDELLAMSTNRSGATFIAVDLLQQFIRDINTALNVTVLGICGNESRLGEDIGWVSQVATDNYDATIFNILRLLFKDAYGVEFIDTDPLEAVVEVAGHNILFMHGHSLKGADIEKAVAQICGKKAAQGVLIRYVITGHLHSARIGDLYARGSSLCGANAYSDKGLQLESRASQNMFFVYPNGNIDGIKVDLQVVDMEQTYPVEAALEAYNAKSTDKLAKALHIHKLTI